MDKQYLAEIEARVQAATQSPWPRDGSIFTATGISNCELIANVPIDMPALISEVTYSPDKSGAS